MEVLRKPLKILLNIKYRTISLLKKVFNWLWDVLSTDYAKYLLSGLIPTLILLYWINQELNQAKKSLGETQQQIKIMQEDILYKRTPILVFFTVPERTNYFPHKLHIANIGNDIAVKIEITLSLFVMNDDTIFTYSALVPERKWVVGQMWEGTDSARALTGTEKVLIPHLYLKPDQDTSLALQFNQTLLSTYYYAFLGGSIDEAMAVNDMLAFSELVSGRFYLLATCSYRRASDLALRAETTLFDFDPFDGPDLDVLRYPGGKAISNRIKAHLENPQLFVHIQGDRFQIVERSTSLTHPDVVKTYKRVTK